MHIEYCMFTRNNFLLLRFFSKNVESQISLRQIIVFDIIVQNLYYKLNLVSYSTAHLLLLRRYFIFVVVNTCRVCIGLTGAAGLFLGIPHVTTISHITTTKTYASLFQIIRLCRYTENRYNRKILSRCKFNVTLSLQSRVIDNRYYHVQFLRKGSKTRLVPV